MAVPLHSIPHRVEATITARDDVHWVDCTTQLVKDPATFPGGRQVQPQCLGQPIRRLVEPAPVRQERSVVLNAEHQPHLGRRARGGDGLLREAQLSQYDPIFVPAAIQPGPPGSRSEAGELDARLGKVGEGPQGHSVLVAAEVGVEEKVVVDVVEPLITRSKQPVLVVG